jgi:hypothetical protein
MEWDGKGSISPCSSMLSLAVPCSSMPFHEVAFRSKQFYAVECSPTPHRLSHLPRGAPNALSCSPAPPDALGRSRLFPPSVAGFGRSSEELPPVPPPGGNSAVLGRILGGNLDRRQRREDRVNLAEGEVGWEYARDGMRWNAMNGKRFPRSSTQFHAGPFHTSDAALASHPVPCRLMHSYAVLCDSMPPIQFLVPPCPMCSPNPALDCPQCPTLLSRAPCLSRLHG